jgi:hypothetical protein
MQDMGPWTPTVFTEGRMPKVIPDKIRLKAMELYLEGNTVPAISAALGTEFNVEVKIPTIYAWSKQYKWKEDKVEARTAAVETLKESETQRYARIQEEHLTDYGRLRKKASAELDGHMFDRPFEAAKALDIGIKGERIVIEGMINLQFVQDIMSVLVEEVQDADTLKRIAFKLKALTQTQDANGNK